MELNNNKMQEDFASCIKTLSILTIIFYLPFTSNGQKDTIHVGETLVLNSQFTLFGQFDTGHSIDRPNNTRFAYGAKLRAHYFVCNKFAVGVGLKYFDYYFARDSINELNRPWNAEIYSRYYPHRNFYIEPSIIYGGYVRDSTYFNKLNFVGSFSIGYETPLNKNWYIEFEIRTNFPIERNSWSPAFGRSGNYFVGFNYYIRK